MFQRFTVVGEDRFTFLRKSHGGCGCPPDTREEPPFESLSLRKTKQPTSFDVSCFVVGEDGFEPSKRYAADLQSVPFGHSGTPPYEAICLSGWSR